MANNGCGCSCSIDRVGSRVGYTSICIHRYAGNNIQVVYSGCAYSTYIYISSTVYSHCAHSTFTVRSTQSLSTYMYVVHSHFGYSAYCIRSTQLLCMQYIHIRSRVTVYIQNTPYTQPLCVQYTYVVHSHAHSTYCGTVHVCSTDSLIIQYMLCVQYCKLYNFNRYQVPFSKINVVPLCV